ncbi:MAG TPA: hypothetical protein VM600_09555 [Actinomycetota bacterium]|nr:hypothetical protein [Actinomycetota bacterium]
MSEVANGSELGAPLRELEAQLLRIPGVNAARIVGAIDGRVSEVHVVADATRGAKQVVRDVQSIALASFGIEVDYRTVSVVNVETPQPPAPVHVIEPARAKAEARIVLNGVRRQTQGHLTNAEVDLQAGGSAVTGRARGASATAAVLVARATADALASIADVVVEVERAEITRVGDRSAAFVAGRLVTPGQDRTVLGSAFIAGSEDDAVARATLNAVNRVISAD